MTNIMEVAQLKNDCFRFQRLAIFILQKKKKRKRKSFSDRPLRIPRDQHRTL